METLGERLRGLRAEKGVTQQQVAAAVGVNKSAVSFWELDINEPKATYIKKLADYFDVTCDYLLGAENEDGSKVRT